MWNNIAVVLRGHLRTWEWNAPQVFDFYSKISRNVDYYFSTWLTPEFRHNKIEKTFNRVNIQPKAVLKVSYQDREYTSWGGPALLSLHALPHVRQQHKQNPYDVIFDTRPDVAPLRIEDIPITPIQENTLYTTMFTNLLDCHGDRNVGMMDHMLVSDFDTYESMCDRIIVDSSDTKECHVDIREFAQKQGARVSNSLTWMKAEMTRPCGFVRFPNVLSQLRLEPPIEPEKYPPWESCTIEQRLELLSLQGIESIDYVTNNGNIAVEDLTDEVRDRFRNK